MAPRTPNTLPAEDEAVEPHLEALVTARYVGVEPVLAVFAGVQQIIEPGDPIVVTGEQLAQNPVFEPWED